MPGSHAGGGLTVDDYDTATVTYTNASGRTVNTGLPGRHLTVNQHDRFGNTVFAINATNLELALGTGDYQVNTLTELGILADSPAERARLLGTVSVYSDDGQRFLEEYGPVHLVTLTKQLGGDADSPDVPVGTQVAARTHTVNRYDENRPTDGTAVVSDQLTSTRVGAFADGYPADGDVRTTANRYDWVKGLQTGTVTDPTGLNPVHSTSYDAQGRVIKTTLPKSNGSDAGARVTTYWSATGTGTCQGRPEWADLACTTGPAAKITGGGSQPDELPVSTTQYDRWGDPTIVTETAYGTTRTTESTYDAAGRLTSAKVTGGTGAAVPPRTVTYDPVNGAAATVGNRTATVRRTSDALGRVISYDRPRPRRRRERVRLSRRPGQPVRPGRQEGPGQVQQELQELFLLARPVHHQTEPGPGVEGFLEHHRRGHRLGRIGCPVRCRVRRNSGGGHGNSRRSRDLGRGQHPARAQFLPQPRGETHGVGLWEDIDH
ncbi:hypothetical protein AMK21_24380 [Streptomyces sp. CB00316]|uniref:hypothetical protein n=1 Tax=Streptomyces sp. CB00316 TaxID=1703932 RepID=UPI00093E5B0F|nr:hypothetical protein [Streptomyces sp. CB00316]OKJ18019.1 hypothetical protein AMK21_24380 [Streptomyces sp. CB00316]